MYLFIVLKKKKKKLKREYINPNLQQNYTYRCNRTVLFHYLMIMPFVKVNRGNKSI